MINEIVENQRKYFHSGKTKTYEARKAALGKLHGAIKKHENDILDALVKDLNKPHYEGFMTEVGLTLDELHYVTKHLAKWMKPERVKASLMQLPAKCRIYNEPFGVALIMAPWNYPFMLTMEPLIGALAAGNCAVVKPSAYSPATSAIIKVIIEECFPSEYVAVIEGGRKENAALLDEKFDYIFFTGSVEVGKLVMESASRYLTPVSLELGGKSPCIVDESADIAVAAKRLVFGKYINGGQTCVAPDYLYVHESVKAPFIEEMKKALAQFYPNGDYTTLARIINEKHYARLMGLIVDADILLGGRGYPSTLMIEPTMLDNITWDAPVMQEEIFGPVLPILKYTNIDDVIDEIVSRPKPLALYLFTQSKTMEEKILARVSFGGGCINDTLLHLATPHMGFGGVGESGMGNYHGKRSFKAFSHEKSVMKKSKIDNPLRYRPYTERGLKLFKMIFK